MVFSPPPTLQKRAPIRWLLTIAVLVAGIVVIGGITRLTESGLSIIVWQPISGVLPPLSEAAWQAQFAAYRHTPQFLLKNGPAGMTLAQYQTIYFWEWGHRLLARLIGLVAAGGWLWLIGRRAIPRGFGARLLLVPILVGVQGLLGWLMVRSGLQPGMVAVAPGWLAAHLFTALVTLAYTVWMAASLATPARNAISLRPRPTLLVVAVVMLAGGVLAVQLIYGALMAGLHAGLVTDQWPLMNGRVFPGASARGESTLAQLTADPAIVHFFHRWWAWVTAAMLLLLARAAWRRKAYGPGSLIVIVLTAQMLLGIATVVSGVSFWLAVLHQLCAACLVAATAWGAQQTLRR